jgi:lipopolysaccharide/colanic/teichoic acid biosynthesis glycosyltransferase
MRFISQSRAGAGMLQNGPGRKSGHPVLSEVEFQAALRLERRRTERSERPFLLMLADFREFPAGEKEQECLAELASRLATSSRETDIIGWRRQGLGGIFTELSHGQNFSDGKKRAAFDSILQKIAIILDTLPGADNGRRPAISLHFFPADPRFEQDTVRWLEDEHHHESHARKTAHGIKRVIDVGASSLALIAFFPFLLAIALMVKFTSRGPGFFQQTRVGQHGRKFTFLKFRSMYLNNDPSLHQEYVSHFIAGKAAMKESADGTVSAYKLIDDPRVTPLGRILRKTSLDELPQLLNVLSGDMSLVGPRPPLPYEFSCYSIWHRRRISDVKPGITGLWQVSGRSCTSFDEMVRLDLQYARKWSLSLDMKILLKTPAAVFSGDGAY